MDNANGNMKPDLLDTVDPTNPRKTDDVETTGSRILSICLGIKNMKKEIVVLAYLFAVFIRRVTLVNLMLDKACLVHFEYAQNVCANLSAFDDLKPGVEKLANNYQMAYNIIQMLLSILLCGFVGAWSDNYGRKVPMIVILISVLVEELGCTLCAAVFNSRLEYLLIPTLFSGITGGNICFMMILYSYAADTTPPEKRTSIFAYLEIAFAMGVQLGELAGGWLFKFGGYVSVFLVSLAFHLLTLGLVVLFFQEVRGLDSVHSWTEKVKSFFSFKPFIESFKTTIKPRSNNGRTQILLLMIAGSTCCAVAEASESIEYIFVHYVFNWGNTKFSTIAAIFSILSTFSTLIAVATFKRFSIRDPIFGITGNLSFMAQMAGKSISKTQAYFAGSLLGLLNPLSSPACYARMSKISSEDFGKVFTFYCILNNTLIVVSRPAAAQILNATMESFPGATYVVLAILLVIPVAIYSWLAVLPDVDYKENFMSGAPDHQ